MTRRGMLRSAATVVASGLSAVAATLFGRAAVGASLDVRPLRWVRAARLDELETDIPTPITLRVTRRDGYLEVVDQQVVFLTRSSAGSVRALSSRCAHLGCSVTFSREKEQFLCPCHNGQFNLDGSVAAGPPPRGLDALPVKVDRAHVVVQV